jgi:hypothetical protein
VFSEKETAPPKRAEINDSTGGVSDFTRERDEM